MIGPVRIPMPAPIMTSMPPTIPSIGSTISSRVQFRPAGGGTSGGGSSTTSPVGRGGPGCRTGRLTMTGVNTHPPAWPAGQTDQECPLAGHPYHPSNLSHSLVRVTSHHPGCARRSHFPRRRRPPAPGWEVDDVVTAPGTTLTRVTIKVRDRWIDVPLPGDVPLV